MRCNGCDCRDSEIILTAGGCPRLDEEQCPMHVFGGTRGMTVTFTVPGQPQGKGRAKIVRIGGFSRMATPQKTVAYEGLIAMAAQQAMVGRAQIDGPADVTLDIVCQIPASWSQRKRQDAIDGRVMPTTKPDIDNVEKAVFDGCNGVVWRDDVQVVSVTKRKRYGLQPGVLVAISAVTTP